MTYKTDEEENARDAIFVDFLIDDEETKVYEEVIDYEKLRDHLIEKLERFNTQLAANLDEGLVEKMVEGWI